LEATSLVCTWKPFARSASTAAGDVSPTTFGTADVCADETERVTTDRRVTFAPGFGSCATTVPGGAEPERVEMRATRPRRLRRETASCCCNRTTFGTFTVETRLWPLSRVSSQTATRPPATSSRSSRSQGQRRGRGGGCAGGGGGTTSSSTTGAGSSTRVVASDRRNDRTPPFIPRRTKPRTSR
jgi:uncharacterized membrane protein YgcG